jgi:hypothetical protein
MKMVIKSLCCSFLLLPWVLHAAGVAGGGGGAQGRSYTVPITADSVRVLPQFEIGGDHYRRYRARLSSISAAPMVVRVEGEETGRFEKAVKELQLQSMHINHEPVLVGVEANDKVWRIEAEARD